MSFTFIIIKKSFITDANDPDVNVPYNLMYRGQLEQPKLLEFIEKNSILDWDLNPGL